MLFKPWQVIHVKTESQSVRSLFTARQKIRLFSFLGIPRLFLPLVMYIIDAIFGSIKAFESQATCTSFPWLSFLNQIITFLDSNYKLLFDRLWPRRRGTGGAQDATVSGDEEDDAAGHKKKKKKTDKGGKEPEKSKKSATKTKVKKETQSTVSSKKWFIWLLCGYPWLDDPQWWETRETDIILLNFPRSQARFGLPYLGKFRRIISALYWAWSNMRVPKFPRHCVNVFQVFHLCV